MTDGEVKALIRKAREGFSKPSGREGYYIQRGRVPAAKRVEVDAWVVRQGGTFDDEWYLLPFSVSIE